MRIKSYFAASVQSAIGLARKEFGDDVTLVTSHASALDSRHLGNYEVVFAVDDPVESEDINPGKNLVPVSNTIQSEDVVQTESAPEPSQFFQNLLNEAIDTKPSTHDALPEKLDHVRSCLIEIGLEPSVLRALMIMIERCAPASGSVGNEAHLPGRQAREARPVTKPDPAAKPQFTPAEMAFVLSVSC